MNITAKTTLCQAVAIAMVRSSLAAGGVRQTFPLFSSTSFSSAVRAEMVLLCSWYTERLHTFVFYGKTASGEAWEVCLSPESTWGSNELPSLFWATFDPSVDDQDAHGRLTREACRLPM